MVQAVTNEVLDKKEANIAFVKSPAVLMALRVAAASGDAFVYAGAVFVLQHAGEAVPIYRQRAANDFALEAPVESWSIDSVAAWVARQPFRQYKRAFARNLVTGRVLMTLSEADLADVLGVANALHRRTILFAISDLSGNSGGGGACPSIELARSPLSRGGSGVEDDDAAESPHAAGSLRSPSRGGASAVTRRTAPSLEADGAEEYDVFISYRRAGGADFAQLLKLLLKAERLKVFLDTENLGTGDFQAQLVHSLRRSKNVVLVWTKGCMDRFLDDADQSTADFVRLEYKLAISMVKSIIPVYKEDFSFPAADRLPADIRDVLALNAVKWVGEYRDASLKKLVDALRL